MGYLIYDPKAKVEIKNVAEYYKGCREGLGQAFLREVESTIQRLSQHPLTWRKISGQFRRCLLKKFPYGIIYSVDKDEIFVAAVMHLKRKPEYWKKRIKK